MMLVTDSLETESIDAQATPHVGSQAAGRSRACGAGRGGAERRRGLRIYQARPVKVFEHAASRYFGGQTHDVSATGLRLELPSSAAVRPGKIVSIHVGLSSSGSTLANRRQMIPARVVWVNRTINGVKLMAGVEFLASIAADLDAA